jgi:hypothetical protein
MQEAALANELVFLCGKHEISGKDMIAASLGVRSLNVRDANNRSMFGDESFDAWGVFDVRVEVRLGSKFKEEHYSNAELLLRVSQMMVVHRVQCLLAEDRIWGLLGFSTSTLLHHNLQHALDTDTLYTRFSRYILSQNDPDRDEVWWQWLDLAFTPLRTPTLPSWVPDFHLAAQATRLRPARDYVPDPDGELRKSGVGTRVKLGKQMDKILPFLPRKDEHLDTKNVETRASRKSTKFKLGERMEEIILHGKELDEVVDVIDGIRDQLPFDTDMESFQALHFLCRMADWMDLVDAYLDKRGMSQVQGKLPDDKFRHMHTCWRIVLRLDEDSEIDDYVKFRAGLDQSRHITAKYNGLLG